MHFKFLKVEVLDGIAVITLNNPPLNVLSTAIFLELDECFKSIETDNKVKVIILTGTGDRAFAAGADIKEFTEHLKDYNLLKKSGDEGSRIFNQIAEFPKPVIVALNGLALGGGFELALCGDIRIASSNVKIGLPEINLGLLPGAGGTQRLPRLIGESKAKEMIFTGKPITADEAYRIGLVNHVVESGEVLVKAKELAHLIAVKSSVALKIIKKTIDLGLELSLDEGIRKEREAFEFLFQQDDAKEGINAFLNKREPKFH
ncbi:enoyl-CoA hydratase-related protein [Bacillus sp. JJ1533]|uniref:enoyl-CoA hydratase/isomerase family protein n=1 Tax=Bacillus sp. JJ1533 TaxID=3122959 RepID=UPI00300075A9